MKKFLSIIAFLFICVVTYAENATLTIRNNSHRNLTIKLMKLSGGVYQTVFIGPRNSRIVNFYQSGYFYTKVKAERNQFDTMYSKGEVFYIQNDNRGYSENELTFTIIESKYPQSSGERISKSEFEKDN